MITEELEKLLNNKTVICSMDDPVALAYTSLYEEGDVWIKTVSCKDCPKESQRKCCGTCPMLSEMGCYFHLMKPNNGTQKPFGCIAHPHPTGARSYCQLEFLCIKGTNIGKVRCVKDKRGVLKDGTRIH